MNLQYWIFKLLKKIRLFGLYESSADKTCIINSGSFLYKSSMGRYSYCGYNCEFIFTEIGSFCSIASGVCVGGAMHGLYMVSTSPIFELTPGKFIKKFGKFKSINTKKTIIGNDVWIGQNVIIKQGLVIGNGSVIGMGSVVTKDVPPYAIVAGNPARIIRYRFDDKVIAGLEESKWWNYTEKDLEYYGQYFDAPEIFLQKIKQ